MRPFYRWALVRHVTILINLVVGGLLIFLPPDGAHLTTSMHLLATSGIPWFVWGAMFVACAVALIPDRAKWSERGYWGGFLLGGVFLTALAISIPHNWKINAPLIGFAIEGLVLNAAAARLARADRELSR